jgi:signal transduction histidine kinase/ligand-binding sensor domain-containing protein
MRFLILLFIGWAAVHAQQYVVQNYTTSDGMPHNVVFDILQDREYRLWIATLDGVAWYDGQKFTRYSKSDGLADNRIWTVTETSTGDFWFASRLGATRMQFPRPVFAVVSARHGLPSDNVMAIAEDSKRRLWFLTLDGVVAIPIEDASRDSITFDRVFTPPGLPKTRFVDLTEDRSGRLWLASTDEVFVVSDDRVSHTIRREALGGRAVRRIFADRDGAVWILGHDGLMAHVASDFSVQWPVLPASIRDLTFYDILEDGGRFWVSTNAGVLRIAVRSGSVVIADRVDDGNGLINPIVLPLVRDHEQNIWLGTHNGLSRLTNPDVRIYFPGGRRNVSVFRVIDDGRRNVWMASSEGLYVLDRTTGSQRIVPSLPVNQIFDLAFDGSSVWVGGESGLWIIDATTRRLVRQFAELSSVVVTSILIDNETWIGTNQGVYRIRNGRTEVFEPIQGVRVHALSRDNEYIWIGTGRGAYQLSSDEKIVRHWTTQDGLGSTEIGHVFRDSRGHVWFATEGGGVSRWDGSRMTTIAEELSNRIVYRIAEPFPGHLWLAHAKGIDRVQLNTLRVDRLTHHEGYCIKGAITYGLDRSGDSLLWVSTSLGAVQLKLMNPEPARYPLPMRFKNFAVNREDRSRELDTEPSLSYDQNQIDVEIGAISFLYGPDLLYQFRLDGAEREWSTPSPSGLVRYFNLPPGSYTLRARTVAPNQTIEGEPLRFTIDMPFWQKAWFILLTVVFLTGAVISFYRWRTLALRRRAQLLAHEVDERTRNLATQKAELEKTLAVLKETQAQLIQAEKLSSLGQLVAGIAHEINNPLSVVYGNVPLLENDLKKLIADASTESRRASAEETLNAIREASRRIMDIVEMLRRFSRLDEAVQKDAALAECVDNAVAILKFQYPALRVEVTTVDGVVLRCFPQELQQALYHIMLNGVQAQNGVPRLHIQTDVENAFASVRIRDFGKGIPPEIHSRIFDPFFTTKDVGEGRGLGLSLAYGIVQKHRGTITFTSSPEGTEFEVRLPLG